MRFGNFENPNKNKGAHTPETDDIARAELAKIRRRQEALKKGEVPEYTDEERNALLEALRNSGAPNAKQKHKTWSERTARASRRAAYGAEKRARNDE